MERVTTKGLLSIPQAAQLVGVNVRTLRRRLTRLQEQHGNVLVSFERQGARRGKYFIRHDRLMEVWAHEHQDDFEADEQRAARDDRLETLELRLTALRNAHRATRAELASLRRELESRVARLEGRHVRAIGDAA